MGKKIEEKEQLDQEEMLDLIPKELSEDIQNKLKNQVLLLKNSVVTFDELQEHVQKLYSVDIVELHYGLCKFRKFLGSDQVAVPNEQNIQEVLDFNIAPKIFDIIREQQTIPLLLCEAAWIVANMAYGTYDQIKIIQQNGGIELLLRLLTNEKQKVWEQAVWAIGNISADCVEFRNELLQKGAIDLIIKVTKVCVEKESSFLPDCAWTLCNLCRGKPAPQIQFVIQVFDILSVLLSKLLDEESLQSICWAISNISDSEKAIPRVIKSGVVPRLVELLNHQSKKIRMPALRVIGNILTGNEEQTNYILNLKINFKELLRSTDDKFVREVSNLLNQVCWCLSNITAGSQQQVKSVIQDAQLIKQLIELVQSGSQEIKKEIAWIFANASSQGDAQEVINIADSQLIEAFSTLLDIEHTQSLITFLEGIFILLKKAKQLEQENQNQNQFFKLLNENQNFVMKIEKLQSHQNCEIYQKALNILETFFAVEPVNEIL